MIGSYYLSFLFALYISLVLANEFLWSLEIQWIS